MRADRLVATLLTLQARGRVTAAQLAEELEVSVATARRDLEALSAAGIPVYPQAGRGGGWQLLGGARTDLSGLTGPEARALFLLVGPAASVDPDAKAALRKLVRALPESFRSDAAAAAQAVVIDAGEWGRPGARTPRTAPGARERHRGATACARAVRRVEPRPRRPHRRPVGARAQAGALVPARWRRRRRAHLPRRPDARRRRHRGAGRAARRPRPRRAVGAGRRRGRATACRSRGDRGRRRGHRAAAAHPVRPARRRGGAGRRHAVAGAGDGAHRAAHRARPRGVGGVRRGARARLAARRALATRAGARRPERPGAPRRRGRRAPCSPRRMDRYPPPM